MPLVRDEAEFEAKRQLIMQGALKVFAERGFERATNKAIAEAAGIGSPGLIYHYFKDKGDLFIQAVTSQSPAIIAFREQDVHLLELPLEEFVGHITRAMMNLWTSPTMIPLMKIMLGEAMRNPDVINILNHYGPGVIFSFMYRYFERQIALGTVRPLDPGVIVRSLMGPLIAYVFAREILTDLPSLDADVMLEQGLEIFLRGVKAEA